MPTITYTNSVIIKNTIILNIIHNIFNLRDTEVVICILLVLLKRADGLNHHLLLDSIQGYRMTTYNSETMVNFEPKYNCREL
jgi:hypothetical protein